MVPTTDRHDAHTDRPGSREGWYFGRSIPSGLQKFVPMGTITPEVDVESPVVLRKGVFSRGEGVRGKTNDTSMERLRVPSDVTRPYTSTEGLRMMLNLKQKDQTNDVGRGGWGSGGEWEGPDEWAGGGFLFSDPEQVVPGDRGNCSLHTTVTLTTRRGDFQQLIMSYI